MRSLATLALITCLLPSPAYAQAPPTAPLVLSLPASTRAVALGNAWVTGRDREVLFYNPAQLIGARQEFDLAIARYGRGSTMASLGSVYAAGKMSLTLGWGVQFVDFTTSPAQPYPYAPDVLLARGSVAGFSTQAAVGGAIVYKGFRIGAAGKYVSDRVSTTTGTGDGDAANHSALLADFGVARNLLGGVGGLSVQNIGRAALDGASSIDIPRQVSLGWSATKQAGPLDLGMFSQVTARHGWVSPGAGLEVGYSWIEGYSVAIRAGARRPETTTERPVAIGAAFTADRLTIEYAVQFFHDGRYANRMTVRWR